MRKAEEHVDDEEEESSGGDPNFSIPGRYKFADERKLRGRRSRIPPSIPAIHAVDAGGLHCRGRRLARPSFRGGERDENRVGDVHMPAGPSVYMVRAVVVLGAVLTSFPPRQHEPNLEQKWSDGFPNTGFP